MWHKVFRVLVLVTLATLVLGITPVSAQAPPPANTPDDPMILTGEWTELAPGATHIYKFYYGATEDKFGSGGLAHMEIRFYAAPAGSARLTLRNRDQMRLWSTQGKNEWFGLAQTQELSIKHDCNFKNKVGKGDGYDRDCLDGQGNKIWLTSDYQHWEATLGASGNYWVVVQTVGSQPAPVAYKIVVSGPGFSFWGGNPQ